MRSGGYLRSGDWIENWCFRKVMGSELEIIIGVRMWSDVTILMLKATFFLSESDHILILIENVDDILEINVCNRDVLLSPVYHFSSTYE